MTWYDSAYKRRYPVTVDVTGGAESSGTEDVSITFPSDWDDFWTNIRSDFNDVIITDSNGTLQSFHRATENFANRSLQINVDNVTFANRNSINIVYVYFNNPDEATDRSVAFVPASPKTGKIFLAAPSNRIVSQPIPKNGTTTPNSVFSKTSVDEVYIWFRVNSLLASRVSAYNDRLDFESVDYIKVQSLDSSSTNDTNRYIELNTAVIPGYIGVYVKGGTNATDYTVECRIQTVGTGPFNQIFSLRALLQIRDLLPI